MQLFAYPTSRQFPWATTALFLASGCVSAAVALHWQLRVSSASSVEELRERSERFAAALALCGVSSEDLARGEVHRLALASLLHAGDQPGRLLADAAVLACCGTLLERLRGSGFVLALVLGGTAAANALAASAHGRSSAGALDANLQKASGDGAAPDDAMLPTAPPLARISSTSGGVTALGAFVAFRYGRWAALPGLPLPVAWLMAPVLVATLSSFAGHGRQLKAYREAADEAAAARRECGGLPPAVAGLSALEAAVVLAACEAVEDRARGACQPPPEDVAAWREEIQEALVCLPPQPPDGAFFADVAGAAVGVLVALLLRGR